MGEGALCDPGAAHDPHGGGGGGAGQGWAPKDAADAETVANEMQKNADPGKWICVRAEAVQIGVSGDIIVMVMTSEEEATALITAFTELCGGELDLFLEQ